MLVIFTLFIFCFLSSSMETNLEKRHFYFVSNWFKLLVYLEYSSPKLI